MSYVFCNRCGHRNPPRSAFCSACGTILDVLDERTITIPKIDPLQDAIGTADDAEVNLSQIPSGEAVLVVRAGGEFGERYALNKAITTLGRHPESDIALDDITVSRHHVEIARVGRRFYVRDSGSLNGTYVNQHRIDEAEIRQGDELQVGKFRLVFFESGEDA